MRLLYAAPGNDLAPESGPTRKVLSLAGALARRGVEVALAFRRTGGARFSGGLIVYALERGPGARAAPDPDGVAVRGLDPRAYVRYLAALRRAGRVARSRFDVVIEEGSRVSGFLGAAFAGAGRGLVLAESFRPLPRPGEGARALARAAAHAVAEALSRRAMRRAGRVVVETRTLGKRLVAGGYVVRRGALRFAPDGVDRARFRPLDRIEARRALGLALDRRALVYVGSIDHYHDLFPAIAACATTPAPGIDLHVLGDGIDRAAAEAAAARAGAPVRFHGRIPPEAVPGWIAAADLCLAPYRLEAFPGGEITFSTLKVREYLACGRPVATVPGEATGDLVREGESGFLLPNRADAWSALLARLPGRDGLDAMGLAAAATPIPSWDEVAGVYLDACEEAIAGSRGRARATRE